MKGLLRSKEKVESRNYKVGSKKFKIDKPKTLFMASFLVLPIINFLIFFVYTNINSLVMAFQRPIYDGAREMYYTMENFKKVFDSFFVDADGTLKKGLINTILFYLSGTLIVMPISILMSYFIYKKIPGYRTFRFIAYLPQIITSSALVIIFKYSLSSGGPLAAIYKALGKDYSNPLIREPAAIITLLVYSVMFGFGGNLIIYCGAMGSISSEVLEAGELDGCTWFQELTYLIIPMMWATLSTSFILGLAGILGASGPILAFTKGQYGTTTLAFQIYNLVSGVNGYKDLYYASAIGITMTVVMFPMVMILKRIVFNEEKEK